MNEDSTLTEKPRFFYGWYIVAASWIMTFLVNAVAVGIFFKPMLDEFGWDRATLSSVQTVALVVFAVASPFIGKMIDRLGPRVMIFVTVATHTLSSVVNGLATSLWHLYVGRFLYQMRAMHATQVLINCWFVKKRGRALGIVATSMPIGLLLLSPLSQYLVETWGWRQTMLFWAGVTFIVLLPMAFLIRNRPEEKGYSPDGESYSDPSRTGSFIEPKVSNSGQKSVIGIGSMMSEASRTGSFWLLIGTQLICGIGCGFMTTHIVIFATDIGYPAMIGASFLSVQGGANLIGVLATGYLSDRTSRSRVLSLVHIIRGLSFIIIVIFCLSGGGSLWLLYLAMALFGFGFYTTAPLSSGLVADLFGYQQMGTIIGVVLSCHMVGIALGAYAGGIAFEFTGSYFPVFLAQGVLEFLAAILAFFIRQRALY
ncbi:MFS transporter [Chloroflexota bacterium]